MLHRVAPLSSFTSLRFREVPAEHHRVAAGPDTVLSPAVTMISTGSGANTGQALLMVVFVAGVRHTHA